MVSAVNPHGFITTENTAETASGFGGRMIKSSILDKVRNLKDIKVDFQ